MELFLKRLFKQQVRKPVGVWDGILAQISVEIKISGRGNKTATTCF